MLIEEYIYGVRDKTTRTAYTCLGRIYIYCLRRRRLGLTPTAVGDASFVNEGILFREAPCHLPNAQLRTNALLLHRNAAHSPNHRASSALFYPVRSSATHTSQKSSTAPSPCFTSLVPGGETHARERPVRVIAALKPLRYKLHRDRKTKDKTLLHTAPPKPPSPQEMDSPRNLWWPVHKHEYRKTHKTRNTRTHLPRTHRNTRPW